MQDFSRHPKIRFVTLSVFAYGAATRGAAYLDAPDTGLTTFVDKMVPLHVWAIVWLVVAAGIFTGIWSRTMARLSMSFGASLWLVWGLSYMWATMVGESSRGWVTGSAMFTLAGAMWIVARLLEDSPQENSVEVAFPPLPSGGGR